MQVTHKLFWTRYFFKVHLIELQENRRQILKKRAAEVASKNENEENNWDDVADLADNPTSNTIPAEVQEKLLSEYEKELIGEKYNYANVILFWILRNLGSVIKKRKEYTLLLIILLFHYRIQSEQGAKRLKKGIEPQR